MPKGMTQKGVETRRKRYGGWFKNPEDVGQRISERNKRLGIKPPSSLGRIPSEEHRRKISEALRGIKRTKEFAKMVSERRKGIRLPEEWKRKISEGVKKQSWKWTGDKSPHWKGDKVKYRALHTWVRKLIPKPELCEDCRVNPPKELANRGIYSRDLSQWIWLCKSCHIVRDGLGNVVERICEYCEKKFRIGESRNKRFCSRICYTSQRRNPNGKDKHSSMPEMFSL